MKESLQRIKNLCFKELLIIFKDPKSKFVIIFPLLLQTLIYSFVATLEVYNSTVVVANNDSGVYADEIVKQIQSSDRYFKKIHFVQTQEQARDLINKQKAVGVIEFDNNFSQDINSGKIAQIGLFLDGRRMNTAMMLSNYIQNIIPAGIMDRQKIKVNSNAINVTLETRHWYNSNLEFKWFILPALIGLLMASSMLMIAALSIAREKEMGTFEQLIVSPLTPIEIVIGKGLSCLVIGLIQSTTVLIIIRIIGVPFYSNYIFLFLAVVLYCMTVVGIGISVSTMCVTQQQAILGVFLFTIPLMTLSGFSTPFKNMPLFFRSLSYCINPVYHFMCIIRGLFLKNAGFFDLMNHILMLFGIMIVAIMFSIKFFKKKMP